MVPGIEVAKIDSNKWAITSRGFNTEFANKLLVLIDGRSVYSPLYAGVYWDVQYLMLEDIERIEVIRGPGGTLWGANAVNGVINIITKNAKDTQGTFVTGSAGTEDRGTTSLRHGGKLSDDAYYRVYSKYFGRDEAIYSTSHDPGADDAEMFRSGFRIDWDKSQNDHITWQGDIYEGNFGQNVGSVSPTSTVYVDDNADVRGGNILSRWTRKLSETSDITLQFYYDRTERHTLPLSETRDTFDFDFQHHFKWNDTHDIIWGAGYRNTGDNTHGSYGVNFEPAQRNDQILSTFIQDEITNSIDSLLRPDAHEKQLKFEILQCDTLPAKICTDPIRLKQCLINLINNAIKFTNKGHVFVNISLEYENENQPYIRFDIEDTGIGIEKGKLDEIFDAFSQADNSTTRQFGGTGLGLAITKQLVELLEGRISVSSRPGKGSVFTFIIPANIDIKSQPEMNKYEPADMLNRQPDQTASPKFVGNVLVAEDAPANQMFIKILLEKLGLNATITQDGNEAVQIALVQNYDLILMDMQMPNMNGYEATAALHEKGIKTPIVALTANTMTGDAEKCFAAGCDDYLAKPLDRDELLQVIQKYLPAKTTAKS